MNKAIFFDVDNTLVCREENTICESTIRAIEKLKNIERNSKVDFVKNYGFEANWKNNLYLANGHCVK